MAIENNYTGNIARRIRKLRLERGWDQLILEQQTNGQITRSCISYFENGKRQPSLRSIMILAEAFSVSPIQLFLDPDDHRRHRLISFMLSCDDITVTKVEKYLAAQRKGPISQAEAPSA